MMDRSNLIDLNISNSSEKCSKMASPLIPLPVNQQKYTPRISDIDNNPFDKVLRSTIKSDDPFDCACEISITRNEISISKEDKENIPHLISPCHTPVSKKHVKISKTPIYLGENLVEQSPLRRKDLQHLLPFDKLNTSKLNSSVELNNTSLQCLSESLFNESLNIAFNVSNIEDSNESQQDCSEKNYPNNNGSVKSVSIPTIYINNKCSIEQNTSSPRNVSVSSSYENNPISFNSASLCSSEISNVPSSASYISGSKSQSIFDKAFCTDLPDSSNKTTEIFRKCLSASKPRNPFFFPPSSSCNPLNNSFAGFQWNERVDLFAMKRSNASDDIRTLNKKTNIFTDLDSLDASRPPWLEEDCLSGELSDCEENKKVEEVNKRKSEENVKVDNNINIDDKDINEIIDEVNDDENDSVFYDKSDESSDSSNNQNKKEHSHEVAKTKCLLQNLSDILECNGKPVDKRKLGESLLNSIALALNLDQSVCFRDVDKKEESTENATKQKGDDCCANNNVSVKPNSKLSCVKKLESKIKMQAMKLASTSSQCEKNLKVRNDTEKSVSKGPLKAIIPVTNMAKTRKSIIPKISFGNVTPPKFFQVKKTSTPNELKMKSPVAQSTPNVTKQVNGQMTSSKAHITPKKSFSWVRSSLSRPASSNDLNKSISPKLADAVNCTLSSNPNISQDKSANCSIPSIKGSFLYRRKSASDLKIVKGHVLQSSFEVEKKIKTPSLIKRSTSFQSKNYRKSSELSLGFKK